LLCSIRHAFAAFDAVEHELSRVRAVIRLAIRALHPDEDAEVRYVRAVVGLEIAPVHCVLLRDPDQHVLERNERGPSHI
jgi:hypothetical protein